MRVKAAFDDFVERLKAIYPAGEAIAIAGWVFEVVAGMGQPAMRMHPETEIAAEKSIILQQYLAELLTHKPLQYVLGEAWFYGMKFSVNEQVLIPRPETEELVEWTVTAMKQDEVALHNEAVHLSATDPPSFINRTLLDIGTGSGCIAIALKKALPDWAVTAIDISEGALQVARKNATELGAKVDFIQFDFLDETRWPLLPQFDVIVSNPPYIPLNEEARLDVNVTAHEPHTALFVPDNAPLLFYEKIVRLGISHLKPGGFIMVETHEDYAQQTAALFTTNYTTVICRKDISGKERMVMAQR
jgi:release factor glutamine methyltransferase